MTGTGSTLHGLSWADFDDLAHGDGGAVVVRRLRRAERSRRLLLLRALVDEVSKDPDLFGPLPSPETAWELLARVQKYAPRVLDLMLAHPYTGSWAGYTTRLLHDRITGVGPPWAHIGHVHALAAAAAIRAGLNFRTWIPAWNGGAILPTLGVAHLRCDASWSTAEVHGERGRVEVGHEGARVRVPALPRADAPGWWGMRQIAVRSGRHSLSLRLDDLDPYRGLYEPVPPQRLVDAEADSWRTSLAGAWELIVRHLPDFARAVQTGLDSLVPKPAVPFRTPSASTGEAFGSAIVARPQDAISLAATLVHEFQHNRLSGLLHLTRLFEDNPRERFYTPWRDDPRPLSGVLQGLYAFFGVTAFWRALSRSAQAGSRATFEFAHWRAAAWRTLLVLRDDSDLTSAGRRFVDGIAERLGPWQDEAVPDDLAGLAEAVSADHYAGWRLSYMRPRPQVVDELSQAWLAGRTISARRRLVTDQSPTPVPDGSWSPARADLVRLSITERDTLSETWSTVPDATPADFAYVSGRFTDAVRGYRAELAADGDRVSSWAGLGLAAAGLGNSPAAWALRHYPELVRAVYRKTRPAKPDDLAAWIGRCTY